MGKFKRFIKNVFSISGLEWRDGAKLPLDTTGILLSKQNARTASQRSEIADEQYMISVRNFAEKIVQPLLPGETWSSDYPGESTDKDVGNIPAGTPYSDLSPITFNELFDRIFFVNPPEIVLNSSNISSLTLPVEDEVEIGSTIHFEATAIHIEGAINSANGSPQVELTGEANQFEFTDDSGVQTIPATSNGQAYIGLDFEVVPGANSLLIQIDWDQGNGPYFDEAGNEMNSFDTLRAAGATLIGESIPGLYKAFGGGGAALPATPAEIRAEPSSFLDANNNGEFEFVIPAGSIWGFFFIPYDGGIHTADIAEVFPIDSLNLTTSFVATPSIPMEDGGGNPIDYERYEFDIGGVGYLEDTTIKVIVT